MKKIGVLLIVAIGASYSWYVNNSADGLWQASDRTNTSSRESVELVANADQILGNAYKNKRSDIQIQGRGTVEKVLPDDTKGSRHQKFIIRLSTGQTLLVAHNIDLAPRIMGLQRGDDITFYGEYEWSERGGVVHWTHRDPAGRHAHGWLEHKGRRYQ